MDRPHTDPKSMMVVASPIVGYDAHALVAGFRGNASGWGGRLDESLAFFGEGSEISRRSGSMGRALIAVRDDLHPPVQHQHDDGFVVRVGRLTDPAIRLRGLQRGVAPTE